MTCGLIVCQIEVPEFMKTHAIFFLLLLLLLGCTSAPKHAELESGCDSPGEILSSEIENVSRGYPYRYMIIYLPVMMLK